MRQGYEVCLYSGGKVVLQRYYEREPVKVDTGLKFGESHQHLLSGTFTVLLVDLDAPHIVARIESAKISPNLLPPIGNTIRTSY